MDTPLNKKQTDVVPSDLIVSDELERVLTPGVKLPSPSPAVDLSLFPPILAGTTTPAITFQVGNFYANVELLFESWLAKYKSPKTRKDYRSDVMLLFRFLGYRWPEDAAMLMRISVSDVRDWHQSMVDAKRAPKTMHRRVSSLSSFYSYAQRVAANTHLPVNIPNPAHADFVGRDKTDPVNETEALTATRTRQLMALPAGENLIDIRDRAIIKFYLYTGPRVATGCRLEDRDFHDDDEDPTVKINEKGDARSKRKIGIHRVAADALAEYRAAANIAGGPFFRPRKGPHSQELANRPFTTAGMHDLLVRYLSLLPGAMYTVVDENNEPVLDKRARPVQRCRYSPHSIRATNATLLLEAGVDIRKVQKELGHTNVTTTQIYDKRRHATAQGASHDFPV